MQGDLEKAGVHEGQVLAGKYRIERLLGAGGMGAVVAAHHLQLDEKVAIKFILPDALKNAEAVARFLREARAAVKIKSEHVARVIDVGSLDDGAPYMVMEYLEGGDLSAWLEQHGTMPIEQAVEFVLQACEAIAEAHVLGIVHRDLKPSNLFAIRRRDGLLSVKVLDFGISKITKAAGVGPSLGMTKTHSPVGSPHYMSPEQMESSKTVDPRTDIWALGIILFELLTGRVPFEGTALTEVVARIVTAPPPALRALRPDVPVALERVVLRCLEKDRSKRYGNIAEFAVALGEFGPPRARASVERVSRVMQAAAVLSSVEPAPPPASTKVASSSPTVATWGRTGMGARPDARVKYVITVAGLALSLVIVGLLLRQREEESPRPVTSAAPSAQTAIPSVTSLPVETLSPLEPHAVADAAAALTTISHAPTASAVPTPTPPPRRPLSVSPPKPSTPVNVPTKKTDAYDHM
jgi:serine/threonine protein kinase